MASIGQVSRKFRISESTLKRLEAKGVIPRVPRLPVGPRNYGERAIEAIKKYKKKH